MFFFFVCPFFIIKNIFFSIKNDLFFYPVTTLVIPYTCIQTYNLMTGTLLCSLSEHFTFASLGSSDLALQLSHMGHSWNVLRAKVFLVSRGSFEIINLLLHPGINRSAKGVLLSRISCKICKKKNNQINRFGAN